MDDGGRWMMEKGGGWRKVDDREGWIVEEGE